MNIQYNPNEAILLYIGDGIIQAANSQDNRGIVKRIIEGKRPDDAKLLIYNIKNLREELLSEGFNLPTCRIVDNPELEYNEFVIQYGIELFKGTIKTLGEITDFIREMSIEYRDEYQDSELSELFQDAVDELKDDNYQEAFDIYKIIYFYTHPLNTSRIKNKERLHINVINDISGIFLRNQNAVVTNTLLSKAVYLCQTQNILDVSLKIQVCINYAEFLKENEDLDLCYQYYKSAVELAASSKNLFFLFISSMGMGEICYLLNRKELSLEYFYYALNIIPTSPQNTSLKLEISTFINYLQDSIIKENQSRIKELSNIINKLQKKRNSIITQIATNVLQSVIQSLVIKILGTSTAGPLMLFGKVSNTEIKTIENSGILQIGKKNIMNKK